MASCRRLTRRLRHRPIGISTPSPFPNTMRSIEQQSLLSERSALERMIADMPVEDVIDLRSLKVRLEIINRELAELSGEAQLGQDTLQIKK